ncbi:hypothetical protein L2E82_12876 [Cichorium intybus]|uniref:Uncharacterized protein n=1 Tax=Cichorium intybus TaxID=13427 RepID=A0ACB9GH15_CICIN|nr:hypothetical protein L2E82_12876 [Cichorium intybus]
MGTLESTKMMELKCHLCKKSFKICVTCLQVLQDLCDLFDKSLHLKRIIILNSLALLNRCIEIECLHGANGGGLKEFSALMRKFIQLEHLVLLVILPLGLIIIRAQEICTNCETNNEILFTRNQLSCRSKALSPSAPIVCTATYQKYRIDDSPLGTNAIMALLAYSRYDMFSPRSLTSKSYLYRVNEACISFWFYCLYWSFHT